MAISYTILKNFARATTCWKELWLDVLVLSVSITLAASGLCGLLRLNEESSVKEFGSAESQNGRSRSQSETELQEKEGSEGGVW